MQCTNVDYSGDTLTDCGNEDFDLQVPAMLTVDLSGEPDDHQIDFDGFTHDDLSLVCKKCGSTVESTTEIDKALTVLLIKLHKRLGGNLALFSSYGFEDGTTICPDDVAA